MSSPTRMARLVAVFAVAFLWTGWDSPVVKGQNIGVTTPLTGVNDSFYENVGVGFAFQMGNPNTGSGFFGSFNQGSINSAVPPFGGYDPAADLTFGFGSFGRNGNFSLGLRMGQGDTRTMTGTAPSVVVPNGGIGSIFDGSLIPFVTGVVPVVGNPFSANNGYGNSMGDYSSPGIQPFEYEPPPRDDNAEYVPDHPLDVERGNPNSTAQQAAVSVAQIKRQREEATKQVADEIERLVSESDAFAQSGDYVRARSRLRQAVKKANGRQRYELQIKYEALADKGQ